MKSTGEVMGIGATFGAAFAKAQIGAGTLLPTSGSAFLSVRDEDKAHVTSVARRLADIGFTLVATKGTAAHLRAGGLTVVDIHKVGEGTPDIVQAIRAGEIALVINTPKGFGPQLDSLSIRRRALEQRVPYFTTIAGAAAAAEGIAQLSSEVMNVSALQDYHAALKAAS